MMQIASFNIQDHSMALTESVHKQPLNATLLGFVQ
jgi:hypothetical protein